MNPSYLYHAFGVRHQECTKTEYKGNQNIHYIQTKSEKLCCPECKSRKIIRSGSIYRDIRSVPVGYRETILRMKVMAVSSKTEEALRPLGISKASGYKQLFSEADAVSLHCPLTPETHHLVNRDRLDLMKPTAILINTGRGPLIDEQALADALTEGKLYAAGLDVLTEEPPRHGSPLISAPNCHITPHIAWASLAARRRLIAIATANLAAFLRGKPQNVV